MVNFGLLTAEICWRVWGTPANFNGFHVLAALLHGTLVVVVSQTLRRWTEGATYIRQGGHHFGHWPTFLVKHCFISMTQSPRPMKISVTISLGAAWIQVWPLMIQLCRCPDNDVNAECSADKVVTRRPPKVRLFDNDQLTGRRPAAASIIHSSLSSMPLLPTVNTSVAYVTTASYSSPGLDNSVWSGFSVLFNPTKGRCVPRTIQ